MEVSRTDFTKRIVHQFSRDNSLQVEVMTTEILKIAERHRADSAEFVMAMADALALVAATLDRELIPQHLDDRLGAFNKRVEEKYVQVLAVMESKNWDADN